MITYVASVAGDGGMVFGVFDTADKAKDAINKRHSDIPLTWESDNAGGYFSQVDRYGDAFYVQAFSVK